MFFCFFCADFCQRQAERAAVLPSHVLIGRKPEPTFTNRNDRERAYFSLTYKCITERNDNNSKQKKKCYAFNSPHGKGKGSDTQ